MSRTALTSLALYVDESRAEAIAAAKDIAALVDAAGSRVVVMPGQAAALCVNGKAASDRFPAPADALVSLGGDGTLLQAAHLAAPVDVPVFGVDFGRMGFLTEVDPSDVRACVDDMLRNGFETRDRTALEARVDGAPDVYFALNEMYLDREHHGRTVTFAIDISDEHVADIPADGIVVASPTGSTAYFLSAGGPIIAPRLDAFGIAPICPHTLFSRPLVVSSAEVIRIGVPAGVDGAQLFADGKASARVAPGGSVTITRARRPVRFVRLGTRHFFEVLERKLHWGSSIKAKPGVTPPE